MDLLYLLQKLEKEERIIRLCLPDKVPSMPESAQQVQGDIPPFNHYSSQVAGKMITESSKARDEAEDYRDFL